MNEETSVLREVGMVFRDRQEAGQRLAKALAGLQGQNPLVLAIPRGALVLGRILADELGGELDVVLVRKIGAPGSPEYAIGAVDERGEVTLTGFAQRESLPSGYVEREAARQLATLRERRASYSPGRAPIDPKGRVVVVVDDGVATGATFRAALALVRRGGPARLIAAMGVAPRESLAALRAEADEVVCLETPSPFFAVGQFYRDFRQVEDDEAIALLAGAGAKLTP